MPQRQGNGLADALQEASGLLNIDVADANQLRLALARIKSPTDLRPDGPQPITPMFSIAVLPSSSHCAADCPSISQNLQRSFMGQRVVVVGPAVSICCGFSSDGLALNLQIT